MNRLFRDPSAPLALLDFPAFARDTFGIDAVELNNIYFRSVDVSYLDRLAAGAAKAGSTLLNIAIDETGDLSSPDADVRRASVASYARWIPIAEALGCAAIRANSGGKQVVDREAALTACTESFRALADVGRTHGVALLIENHWGISSDPAAMVRIVRDVRRTHGDDAMHTLVDWGNWPDDVDRYAAIRTTMPLAGAVHAKVNDIDEQLDHPRFDLARCLTISRESGYAGHLGLEYEGSDDPVVGVTRGATLLKRLIQT